MQIGCLKIQIGCLRNQNYSDAKLQERVENLTVANAELSKQVITVFSLPKLLTKSI